MKEFNITLSILKKEKFMIKRWEKSFKNYFGSENKEDWAKWPLNEIFQIVSN